MAEIRVEPQRRGRGWMWIVLAVILVAALAWYFMAPRRTESAISVDTTGATTTAPAKAP